MMVAAFVAALATQAPTPPGDPRWQVVGRDSHGEYSIDPASVVRHGDRVRVLVRARSFDRGPAGTNLVVIRYDYDCRTNTVRPEASTFYTDDGRPDGAFVERPEDIREIAIMPNSPNAMISAQLCNGPPVADSTW